MTKKAPYQEGDRVRLLPRAGRVIRVWPYRIGRTKKTAVSRHSYLVEWEDGTREAVTERQIEEAEG